MSLEDDEDADCTLTFEVQFEARLEKGWLALSMPVWRMVLPSF